MADWLSVTHCDWVLPVSSLAPQHWKFFAHSVSAYFCGKFWIETLELPPPHPTSHTMPIHPSFFIPKMVADLRLFSSFRLTAPGRGPSSRCDPASRDRRPAAPVVVAHAPDGVVGLARAGEEAAGAHFDPAGGRVGAHHVRQRVDEIGRADLPFGVAARAPDLAARAKAAGVERADGRRRPVAVRRHLRRASGAGAASPAASAPLGCAPQHHRLPFRLRAQVVDCEQPTSTQSASVPTCTGARICCGWVTP